MHMAPFFVVSYIWLNMLMQKIEGAITSNSIRSLSGSINNFSRFLLR